MLSKFKLRKMEQELSVFSILYSKYVQVEIDLADKCQFLKFSNKLARSQFYVIFMETAERNNLFYTIETFMLKIGAMYE